MRQSRFVVLLTLTILGCMAGLSRAQVALASVEFASVAQDRRPTQASTLSQSALRQPLVLVQNSTPHKAQKPAQKPAEQPGTPTAERMEQYQCLEYCAIVRQSCEGLALIQPDRQIATIGSDANTQWSRACQEIHNECMEKCETDNSSVHWKRFHENKKKR